MAIDQGKMQGLKEKFEASKTAINNKTAALDKIITAIEKYVKEVTDNFTGAKAATEISEICKSLRTDFNKMKTNQIDKSVSEMMTFANKLDEYSKQSILK